MLLWIVKIVSVLLFIGRVVSLAALMMTHSLWVALTCVGLFFTFGALEHYISSQ